MSISDKNKHIEDYLDYYRKLSPSPKFAILLKGAWGSGKTWFINQYRNKIEKENKKHLYVSLYGISKFSEIEDSLFQQLHPVQSSKEFLLAGKVLKGLLKGALKIDLNNDGKDDGTWSLSVPDINFPKEFKDSNFSILIFDDLERCCINIELVLGYINSFVESQDLKIVIIANEDEINNKDNNYKRIKEKLIGKTFEIFPDYESTLNDFLSQINDKQIQAKKILQDNDNIDFILNLFKKAENKNLRILNQIILDFVRIFEKLPQNIQEKSGAIQEILQLLVIFSIEISIGKLNSKEIADINQKLIDEFVFLRPRNSQNSTEATENIPLNIPFTDMFSKYKIESLSSNEWFPNLVWWQNFFDKGIIEQKILEEIIPTSKYFQYENTPNWVKLWYYSKLSDKDFKEILDRVNSEYSDKKCDDIGVIKHITGLFLMFSEAKVYEKKKTDILNGAKSYIDNLKFSGKLDISYCDDAFGGYMGRAFMSKDSPEFQEFDNYIRQSQEEVRIKNMPDKANELMELMLKDITGFRAWICIDSIRYDIHEKYYDFPIFDYLPAEKFLEKFLSLSNEDKYFIFSSLKERYNKNGITEKLVSELDFLKKLQELLLAEVEQKQGEISGYILSELNKKYLVESVNNLEKIKFNLIWIWIFVLLSLTDTASIRIPEDFVYKNFLFLFKSLGFLRRSNEKLYTVAIPTLNLIEGW